MRNTQPSSLRKWIVFAITLTVLVIPFPTRAQGEFTLESVNVQLWPEFDQPSMLVIYDFRATTETDLPQELKVRVPAEALVIAVAVEQDGSLFTIPYEESEVDSTWKQVTLTVETLSEYHVEYYASLKINKEHRDYVYLWPGDYAVGSLAISLRVPLDTTEISTSPTMQETEPIGDGQTYLQWGTGNLKAGQQIPVTVTYKKSSDRLSAANQPLETSPVDENTPGRVSLSNYYPYILGGLGILLIVGGGLYFWQSGKGKTAPQKRHRSREENDDNAQIYCHQCGKRAQPGDRFCRTCGTRLRRDRSR